LHIFISFLNGVFTLSAVPFGFLAFFLLGQKMLSAKARKEKTQ